MRQLISKLVQRQFEVSITLKVSGLLSLEFRSLIAVSMSSSFIFKVRRCSAEDLNRIYKNQCQGNADEFCTFETSVYYTILTLEASNKKSYTNT